MAADLGVEMQQAVFISGASRGIGRASALMLDKLSYRVFAGVRRAEDGKVLAAAGTGNIIPVTVEITDGLSVTNAGEQVSAAVGEQGLFALVNNAGIAVVGPLEFMPLENLRQQFEVNVFGHVAVTQAFLPLLRKGKGRIINISSKEGILAMPFVGPYCASKSALEALSDALRMELNYWHIPVSIIEPGTIATEIISRSIASAEECIRQLPQHANELYQSCFDKARSASAKIAESAIPVEKVTRTLLKALTAKNPKPRYTIGPDAAALALIKRLLPDSMIDKLILKQLGL
jgi:NAD(P)-dependent dehydrogenase (short-subunit alcohol dehydrogenase family)